MAIFILQHIINASINQGVSPSAQFKPSRDTYK